MTHEELIDQVSVAIYMSGGEVGWFEGDTRELHREQAREAIRITGEACKQAAADAEKPLNGEIETADLVTVPHLNGMICGLLRAQSEIKSLTQGPNT